MQPDSIRYDVLTTDDQAVLTSDREFLPAVREAEFPGVRLTGKAADLSLLQRVFDGGPYTDDAEAEVVALGTALGDMIARTAGMTWVKYTDEEGVELALRYRDTSIVAFPRSMILKRLERDEDSDLAHLHNQVCDEVRRMVATGEYK